MNDRTLQPKDQTKSGISSFLNSGGANATAKPRAGQTAAGINVAAFNRSITEVPETVASRMDRTSAGNAYDPPTRDTAGGKSSSPGKHPRMTSAERHRRGEQDAFEDRIDEMQTNIGKCLNN